MIAVRIFLILNQIVISSVVIAYTIVYANVSNPITIALVIVLENLALLLVYSIFAVNQFGKYRQ